jgi:hypothetical protein
LALQVAPASQIIENSRILGGYAVRFWTAADSDTGALIFFFLLPDESIVWSTMGTENGNILWLRLCSLGPMVRYDSFKWQFCSSAGSEGALSSRHPVDSLRALGSPRTEPTSSTGQGTGTTLRFLYRW